MCGAAARRSWEQAKRQSTRTGGNRPSANRQEPEGTGQVPNLKNLREQAKCPINKNLREQAKCPINKKSNLVSTPALR
ncbi:MAG: hypothetical protein RBU37_01980 [Myxococcota bacterium]|nr:hypothetical protein [Myxococcota bacterium]